MRIKYFSSKGSNVGVGQQIIMNEETNQSFESTEYIEIRVINGGLGHAPRKIFKFISPEMAF